MFLVTAISNNSALFANVTAKKHKNLNSALGLGSGGCWDGKPVKALSLHVAGLMHSTEITRQRLVNHSKARASTNVSESGEGG